MKSLFKHKKPHIDFLKLCVVFSIFIIIIYTTVSVILNYLTQIELSPTLTTCVYGFFGTEIVSTALIRIFEKRSKNNEEDLK